MEKTKTKNRYQYFLNQVAINKVILKKKDYKNCSFVKQKVFYMGKKYLQWKNQKQKIDINIS